MTRQQHWATYALQRVKEHRQGHNGVTARQEKQYARDCMRTPSLIKQSGALQAIAFLRRKDDERAFADNLASVYRNGMNSETLLRDLARAPLAEYLVLTRDLIDVAVWFRRFAQSELHEEEE